MPKLGLCIVLGPLLSLLLPTWAFVLASIVVGTAIGYWPAGVTLGPLVLLERMGGAGDEPLGIFVAGWKPVGEHEPGTRRWSFEWIAPESWALFKPAWTEEHLREYGQEMPYRARFRRLELPLLGTFTLCTSQDLLAAVEV
jgi:hypothetical protein